MPFIKDKTLSPCPFCGSKPVFFQFVCIAKISCSNENCFASVEGNSAKEAKEKWQKRIKEEIEIKKTLKKLVKKVKE